ncbi:MAG: 5-(carboxyamino)imidazole ribonucleotide synthase [Saprospiraceae bacterium]|nr:5-(carboxyamino)imidazole ribonucleotide synthase [Saprospiraceae bacterium]
MENKLNQKIAILGGGQLGKMLIQAGSRLGLSLSVMDIDREFPAAFVCSDYICGDIRNYDDVLAFGMDADVITIEIENVNIEALEELQRRGKKVFPQPEVLKVIKDKGKQKMFYEGNGFPTSEFALCKNADEVIKAIEKKQLEFPFVQKLRTDGYDGRGVEIIKTKNQLSRLFDKPSVVEDLVEVEKEIAIIVARNSSGEVSTFPAVEMVFHPTANLVEFLSSPANISKELSLIADDIARRLAESLGIIGLLAVEMFVDKNNKILINEVAPRPHNSGHHTIEACVTSQYEMHLRAILDLPLGQTTQIRPAVMTNLLGEPGYTGSPIYQNMELCLAKSGVYPHIYGKKETKPFRKMGHVTITGENLEDAIKTARFVQNNLKVIA